MKSPYLDSYIIVLAENIEKIMTSKYFTTKGSNGTGLGLFVTRKIIAEHNGEIEIKSTEGKGTIFSIALPLQLKTESKNQN